LSSESQSAEFGANLGFPFKGLPVKFGFDAGGANYSSWQSSFCADIRTNMSAREALSSYVQVASPAIVNGFNSCIQSPGLHVWLQRTADEKNFIVQAKFNPLTLPATPVDLNLTLAGGSVICEPAGEVNVATTYSIICSRTGREAVLVAANSKGSAVIGGGGMELPRIPRDPASFSGFVSAVANSRLFGIVGAANWLDTGIDIEANDLLQISANGEAYYLAGNEETKSGPGGHPYTCMQLPTGLKCGGLVGKIGSGPPFFVGQAYSSIEGQTGRLLLAYEDIDSVNNAGGFEVRVSVAAGY
jgi:hypothetical protein